ncbi:MAG: hypothetical protein ACR2PW_04695 [Gammaproteobacteria bacterium]
MKPLDQFPANFLVIFLIITVILLALLASPVLWRIERCSEVSLKKL